jgi:hypothetical protein
MKSKVCALYRLVDIDMDSVRCIIDALALSAYFFLVAFIVKADVLNRPTLSSFCASNLNW